ncbi:ATP-binding protein [Undibacterium sp. Di26W]|uniref:ATP-binding protein n=1 Tax=Undibacterium sp. Di26W TaxID=3413035 RepID=UPI003BF1EBDC
MSDDNDVNPVLLAVRTDGIRISVDAMSEGTRDQLYLALRLAALQIQREAGVDMPVVLDDVLMTSDDNRAALVLKALADFAKNGQVLVFTHHEHILEIARDKVGGEFVRTVSLMPTFS